MADVDDLDAFFEEVSEAEAKATTEDKPIEQLQQDGVSGDGNEIELPATKKAKTDVTVAAVAKPLRPVGVIVASSTSVATKQAETLSNPYDNQHTGATSNLAAPFASSSSTPLHYNHHMIGTKATVALPSVGAADTIVNPPLPQQQQLPSTTAAAAVSSNAKPHKRKAAGKVWVDPTLAEWPENDFRLFVGNLSKDVTDQQLFDHFQKYPSLAKVKVVRDPKNGTSKGFGFCSFLQPMDYAKALREMDQTWLSSRPIRIKRSDWKEHELKNVAKKEKKMFKQQHR